MPTSELRPSLPAFDNIIPDFDVDIKPCRRCGSKPQIRIHRKSIDMLYRKWDDQMHPVWGVKENSNDVSGYEIECLNCNNEHQSAIVRVHEPDQIDFVSTVVNWNTQFGLPVAEHDLGTYITEVMSKHSITIKVKVFGFYGDQTKEHVYDRVYTKTPDITINDTVLASCNWEFVQTPAGGPTEIVVYLPSYSTSKYADFGIPRDMS